MTVPQLNSAEAMTITRTLTNLGVYVHDMAVSKGWYDGSSTRNPAELIALMHSELSEALEGFRTGNKPSDKIPEFLSSEEEFADCIIRILDAAEHLGLNVGAALVAKMEYNRGRERRHGGKQY